MHQIWIIVDEKNKIKHCWEAPDPTRVNKENESPMALDPMPQGWRIIKIKEPRLLKQFQEEAQSKKKTLSRFILDECRVNRKAKPERPKDLRREIEYKEIEKIS